MRETTGWNAAEVAKVAAFSQAYGVDLRTVELDVLSQDSVDAAVAKVIVDTGHIDVLVHNAGHMVFGPAEAFTPEQLAQLYDVNVLSTQRVNRAVLPHLRRQKQGLVVWVSSSSSAGGTPPYLAPYFAAKAGMDAMAVIYARELTRWGIATSIIVPGAFTTGTNHFPIRAGPRMKHASPNTKRAPIRVLARRYWKHSVPLCRPMLTLRRSLKQSSRWWICPSANGLSEPISTPTRMEPMLALLSWTGSAQKCCIDSASEICSFQQRALQNSCHETLAF
jgi:NAD(P)-dependent dehydrogenase (short-subunit alcohol dehydrogenase family)